MTALLLGHWGPTLKGLLVAVSILVPPAGYLLWRIRQFGG